MMLKKHQNYSKADVEGVMKGCRKLEMMSTDILK